MVAVTLEECSSQAEEDAAFAAGATMVVRLDKLPGYVAPHPGIGNPSLHLEFNNFTDSSLCQNVVGSIGNPTLISNHADFSGTGNCIVIADSPNLRFGTGDWSITCEHKLKTPITTSSHVFIASKGVSGNLNNAWYFAILGGGYLCFVTANNYTAIYVPYAYASDITSSHLLTLDSVSGVVTLRVDGVSVATCTPGVGAVPSIYEGIGPLYIGGWNYTATNVSGGLMDNFKLYTNYALHTANFTPDPTF